MKTGITGLPFSGKTSLFCALTGQDYEKLAHARETHIGTVSVPDSRLDRLNDMFVPKKKTPAVMEYFDLAGQAGGGKGMEPQILTVLKNADALTVVLDAYSPASDPRRDFAAVRDEFAFTDLMVVTNRLERLEKELRARKTDQLVQEQALLTSCNALLEAGGSLLEREFTEEERKLIRGFQFLTLKPIVIVVNCSETDLSDGTAATWEATFKDVANAGCAAVCASVEREIAQLDSADRGEFLASMGITEPALDRLIRLSYERLGLISFFTAGGTDEVRAWTVRRGARAPECAGAIHSDLERGFIRAETIAYDDLMAAGSFKDARDKGLLRVEGKEYVVKDGDILNIRFSV